MRHDEDDDDAEVLTITPPYRLCSGVPYTRKARKLEAAVDVYVQEHVKRGWTTYQRPYISREWSMLSDREITDINRHLDRMWFLCALEGKPGEYGQRV